MKAEDRKTLWFVGVVFAATCAVGFPVMYLADSAPTPVRKPPAAPKGETNCPRQMNELVLDSHAGATCWCNGDFTQTETAIGTAQYHELSSPCGSAIHAGAASRYGSNRVTFRRTVGCAAYTGSKMNNKESMSMQNGEPKSPSYIVAGHGTDSCSQSFNF